MGSLSLLAFTPPVEASNRRGLSATEGVFLHARLLEPLFFRYRDVTFPGSPKPAKIVGYVSYVPLPMQKTQGQSP